MNPKIFDTLWLRAAIVLMPGMEWKQNMKPMLYTRSTVVVITESI